jgi:hypothetical protein
LSLITRVFDIIARSSAITLLFYSFAPSHFSAVEKQTNIVEKNSSLLRDEVEAISKLIDEQMKHLRKETELKELMVLFRSQKDEFMAGNQTQKHARAMVSTAREILEGINHEHIAHLFPVEYLEELVFFASVAGKSRPARP